MQGLLYYAHIATRIDRPFELFDGFAFTSAGDGGAAAESTRSEAVVVVKMGLVHRGRACANPHAPCPTSSPQPA
jgi:hypothetical protein